MPGEMRLEFGGVHARGLQTRFHDVIDQCLIQHTRCLPVASQHQGPCIQLFPSPSLLPFVSHMRVDRPTGAYGAVAKLAKLGQVSQTDCSEVVLVSQPKCC